MSELKQDQYWMQQAIELAKRGLYSTKPNPNVGCVIVKDDQLIGEGFHPKAGQPHAEVFALRQAGEQAQGATAYVTLEPCARMDEPLRVLRRWLRRKLKSGSGMS